MKNLVFPELSYKLCGFLFYIHNVLGRFRKERDYADALELVLKENAINYAREANGENKILDNKLSLYRLDFLINNKVIVELKCKSILTKNDYYQLKRYLAAKNLELGLLVNFRDKYLKPRRILNLKNN